MRDLLVRAMSRLWRGIRSALPKLWLGIHLALLKPLRGVSGLWRWFREEAWSARVVALLGMLLSLVSAIEQGFLDPIIDPSKSPTAGETCDLLARGTWSTCWNEWSGWVTLGLSLALLAASVWFGADVRRMRKWSALAADFQSRALDFEALHPDAVTGTLATRHTVDKARELRDELRDFVVEVNTRFAKGEGLPALERIQALEDRATYAAEIPKSTSETEKEQPSETEAEQPSETEAEQPSESEAEQPSETETEQPSEVEASEQGEEAAAIERSPETDAAWESVARLAASTRQLRIERERARDNPILGQRDPSILDGDPRNRWTGVVTMATLLVGLMAAPSVADELTGDDENGVEQSNIAELEGRITDLQNAMIELATAVASDAREDQEEEEPEEEDQIAEEEEEEAEETTEDDQSLPQAGEIVLLGLPTRFGVEVIVEPGDSIWELVEEECGTTITGPTADQVIRTWDANVEIVGANPNEIDIDQNLVILCPTRDPAADE